jgi:hypothetical protein
MQPAPADTAGTGAAAEPCGTNASWTAIAFIRRVQIIKESGALEVPR